RWEHVFTARSAPKTIQFRATYEDGAGRSHTVVQWRDSDRRLRRDTDGVLSVFVVKGVSGEHTIDLFDRRRAARIRISRTNLYRIGLSSDWPTLATNLQRPPGAHRILPSSGGVVKTKVGPCRFFTLESRDAPTRHVCWSSLWGLPLIIERD